jgi:hypothetical protein
VPHRRGDDGGDANIDDDDDNNVDENACFVRFCIDFYIIFAGDDDDINDGAATQCRTIHALPHRRW